MKKALSLLTVALLAILPFSYSIGLSYAQPKVLTFWTMPFVENPEKALAPIIKGFEEKYGVKVEVTSVPYAEAIEKLQIAIAAGAAPDVVYMTEGRYAALVEFGRALLPLDDIINEIRDRIVSPRLLKADYYKGHYWVVPIFYVSYVWVINTDIFKKYGLSEYIDKLSDPNFVWTWDDLYNLLKKLTHPEDEVWGYAYPGGENWVHPFLLWLWQAGGDVYSEDYSRPTLNTTATVRALSFLLKLKQEGIMPPGSETMRYSDVVEAFVTGHIAMTNYGCWPSNVLRVWPKQYPKLHFKPIYPPVGPSGKRDTYVSAGLLAITRQCKDPDLAKEFIKYWLSSKVQDFIAVQFGYFPVIKGTGKELLKDPKARIFAEMVKWGHGEPVHPSLGEIKRIYNYYVQQVLMGKMTPEQAASEMQAKALEVMAHYRS